MDYKDFTKRDVAFQGFVGMRREVLDSADNGTFGNVFTELLTKALANDCIAQDVAAYFFNKGIPDYLMPNYEYYMAWQILAGANGNEFSLEKMEFFLNYGLEAIVNDEQLLLVAMQRKNITKSNALMVISNLICEGIVDELKIDGKKLIDIKETASLYSPNKNRVFQVALEKCLPKVAEFLVS